MVEAGRRLVAGNWKMNGTAASLEEARTIAAAVRERGPAVRVALCPPATLVHRLAEIVAGSPVLVGGQDCRPESCGAFTGDVSAEMLKDAGASLVIVGHSECRAGRSDTDPVVAAKAEAALACGLEPIICLGESLAERKAGRAVEVVTAQLAGSVPEAARGRLFSVAYEPIWAIGTGRTPSPEEIAEVHGALRAALTDRFGADAAPTPILYGGSVKPSNARAIQSIPEVDGSLVGGASLTAREFLPIVEAA